MMNTYEVGLLFGDGVAYRSKKNRSYAIWIDQHERNVDILKNLKKILTKQKVNFCWYKVPDNKIRVLFYSKKECLMLKAVKENPKKFFRTLNSKEKKQFIGGFFDAEGTVTDRLVVYNQNKDLLEEIQKFLKELKITSYIYKFGRVYGLQIYKRIHIQIFIRSIKSVKLFRVIQSGKKRSRLRIRKDVYNR